MEPVSLTFLSVPVRSWASAGPARKLAAAIVETTILRRMRVLRCELTFVLAAIAPFPGAPERPSVSHLNIASRRVLDRFELAAAGLARRDLGRILLLDPIEPIRPPRAGVLLGLGEPFVDVGAGRLGTGPVLVLD